MVATKKEEPPGEEAGDSSKTVKMVNFWFVPAAK